MSQRRRTRTGFVRINTTGQAPADGQHDRTSGKTARSSRTGEGIFKNHGKSLRNHAGIGNHDEDSADDVDDSHKRNDEIGKIGNTLETAQKNGCHEDGDGDTNDIRIDGKSRIDGIGDFSCLNRRSKHHARRHDNGPENRQPAPVLTESILDIPGETAVPDAAYRIFFTVGKAQGNFREFDDQTQHSDEPHPENSARAASSNGNRYTGDIADTQCRCQCRTGRFERLDIAVARSFVKNFTKGIFHDMAEIRKLEESQPD